MKEAIKQQQVLSSAEQSIHAAPVLINTVAVREREEAAINPLRMGAQVAEHYDSPGAEHRFRNMCLVWAGVIAAAVITALSFDQADITGMSAALVLLALTSLALDAAALRRDLTYAELW